MDDIYWMNMACIEARQAALRGEIPVGAVVVVGDKVLGRAGNERSNSGNPLGHAEVLAITRAAENIGDWRLSEATLYVTMEPCPMCSGLMLQTRIKRLVYAIPSYREGCAGSVLNLLDYPGMSHHIEVCKCLQNNEIATIMQEFFSDSRK